jgi:hypothetical protein
VVADGGAAGGERDPVGPARGVIPDPDRLRVGAQDLGELLVQVVAVPGRRSSGRCTLRGPDRFLENQVVQCASLSSASAIMPLTDSMSRSSEALHE